MDGVIDAHTTLYFVKHYDAEDLRTDVICVDSHDLFTVVNFQWSFACEGQSFVSYCEGCKIGTVFKSHHEIGSSELDVGWLFFLLQSMKKDAWLKVKCGVERNLLSCKDSQILIIQGDTDNIYVELDGLFNYESKVFAIRFWLRLI